MLIKAFATDEGLNLVEDDIKNRIKKFILLGDTPPDNQELDDMLDNVSTTYETLSRFIIYENNIHSAYYDDNGFLTFELEIDYASDLQKFIYGVAVISEVEEDSECLPIIVSLSKSGRIFKSAGIGGLYIYKINVTGSPAEIIYQNNDYINLETAQMLDNNTLNKAKEYADEQDRLKSDITHGHNLTNINVTGVLPVSKGGTGNTVGYASGVGGYRVDNVGFSERPNYILAIKSNMSAAQWYEFSALERTFIKYPNYTSDIPYSGGYTNHYAPADGWIWFELHGNGSCGFINNVRVVLQTTSCAIFTPPMPVRVGWSFSSTNIAHFYYNA